MSGAIVLVVAAIMANAAAGVHAVRMARSLYRVRACLAGIEHRARFLPERPRDVLLTFTGEVRAAMDGHR